MSVIDEIPESNNTTEAVVKSAIEESQKEPKGPEGDLSEYTFEGEGEVDDEITEMVKRSDTSANSIEKDITFVSFVNFYVYI